MGTSGSYGGSGGQDWNELQRELDRWLDELPGADDDTANDNGSDDDDPPNHEPVEQEPPDPAVLRVLRPLRRALSARGSGSGGAGGPAGGEPGRGRRSPSGSGRSRARAARVGGRLAAGISALRGGDATALRAIGLDLAELQALDPYAQAQRILEAATEAGMAATLEEEELHVAANRTAIWGLTESDSPSVQQVIHRFVEEYVFEVFLMEGGAILRGGGRDGTAAVATEDRVRRTIAALVRNTPIERDTLDPSQLADIAERVLTNALQIHGSDA